MDCLKCAILTHMDSQKMIVIHDETKLLIERFALDLRPGKGASEF
jgi:hypothetical protein